MIIQILFLLATAGAVLAADTGHPDMDVKLPAAVGSWKISGPQHVEPKGIFNYMDGAGELYIGYRFRFLNVYEYKSPSEDDILVELYSMETSDDAWGLLSGDWGGERVELAPGSDRIRALYGAGLLRLWSGNLYARVMSYRETTEARQAVLAIGKAIVHGRAQTEAPRLVRSLLQSVGGRFSLRSDRVVFLRSHLVLNMAYFLSQGNLLNLGLQCELAAATYHEGTTAKPVRMLWVRYPDKAAAAAALKHFQSGYLTGKRVPSGDRGSVAIEDGWTGFVLSGRALGLVFEAPDEAASRQLLDTAKLALDELEATK